MELTLEEYKKKFTDFKDDAYSHQNNKIGDFITDLLESDVSIDVYKVLYPYYDDIKEEDVDIFEYLLSSNASSDWYSAVAYLSDQKAGAAEYEFIIRRMYENGLSASDVIDCETRTADKEQFIELAENLVLKFGEHSDDTKLDDNENHRRIENEFIKHLKQENERIEAQLENVTTEYKSLQTSHNNTVIELENVHRDYNSLNSEYDLLKSGSKKLTIERNAFEKKYLNQKELVSQLSDINDSLQEKIRKLEADKDVISNNNINEMSKLIEEKTRLADEYEVVKGERDKYKVEVDELCVQIDSLNNKISSMSQAAVNNSIGSISERISSKFKARKSEPIYEMHDSERKSLENFIPEDEEFLTSEPDSNNNSFLENDFDNYIKTAMDNNESIDTLDEDTIEYDSSDLIVIDKKDDGHLNKFKEGAKNFMKAFSRFFNRKFEKLSIEEQKAIITSNLMEKNYSKDVMRNVVAGIKNNKNVQTPVLYRLIQSNASEDEINEYCNG